VLQVSRALQVCLVVSWSGILTDQVAAGNATKANLPERASEAPETARLEALESRCKALERQLTTANRDLKYAKSEVARVVNECSNAKKQHELEMDIQKKHLASQYKKQCQQLTKEHEEEMEKSREKLREKVVTVAQMNEVTEESKRLRKCNRELRQQINAFSTMLESAKDDGVRREKELNETIESLKAELLSQTTLIQYDLQPELDRLRSRKMVDSGEDRTDLRDTSSNSTSTKYILELRDQVLKLQAKSEAEKPLLKVGVAVRLSFLQQQNRHGADGHRKLDERALALKDGLAAARNGNGSADAALFEMGALTNTGELALVFEELYSSTPGKYPEWPHLVKQVVDLSVTLKTFKKCHKGHETNGLRQQHARIRTDIAESWTTASQHPEKSASFEQNESNLLKLKKLEWLTDEIVRFDSKENPTGHPRTLVSHLCYLEET